MKLRRLFSRLTVLSFCFVFLIACQDDDHEPGDPSNPEQPGNKPNFETKITTSVNGFITNENDEPFANVKVTAGNKTANTNESGYFEIENASLVEDISFITAETEGYFRAIRTWRGEKDGNELVRIKMLAKTVIGSVKADSGGEVATADGAKLTFPANAFVKADGSEYTGDVTVAANWMNPATDDIYREMPGDLRAINTNGNMVGLATFGMLGVELTSSSGDLLQVAPDKKVEMRMPIPSDLQALAPQDMPLWYFDETKGLWIEEGTSKRVNNEYVGEVSHFSFWNWDVPYDLCDFRCQITDSGGNPLAGVYIILRAKCVGNALIQAYTNSNGNLKGYIPANCEITLYVYGGDKGCPAVVHEFNAANEPIDIGKIATLSNKEQKISGKLFSCDQEPVTNGYIIYRYDGKENTYVEVINGEYNFTIITCREDNTELILEGYDLADNKKNDITAFIPRSDTTFEVPDMYACEDMSYIMLISPNSCTKIVGRMFDSPVISTMSCRIDYYLDGMCDVLLEAYSNLSGDVITPSISLHWYMPSDAYMGGTYDLIYDYNWYRDKDISGIIESGTVNILSYSKNGKWVRLVGNYKGTVPRWSDPEAAADTILGTFYYSGMLSIRE